MKFITYCLLIGTQLIRPTEQTVTGIAMSVHDKVIQHSKAAAINQMKGMFDQMEFDPFELVGNEVIS
jgi:hypothetical protein